MSVLQTLLRDIAAAIRDMPAEAYTARPAGAVSGPIGGHVRHVLDHIEAFLQAGYGSPLSYDHRQRGTEVETSPAAAVFHIDRLIQRLAHASRHDLDEPVQVEAKISASHTVAGWSSLSRELAFVVSHTIHHQAIIAVLSVMHGMAVSDGFGYAPTTPRG